MDLHAPRNVFLGTLACKMLSVAPASALHAKADARDRHKNAHVSSVGSQQACKRLVSR